jgi:ribosomal protein L27
VGRDHTLFALIDGQVKYEPATKERKKASVYSEPTK